MQRKLINLIIVFFLLFILNINFCYAEIFQGTITGTDVRLRNGPGTNYVVLKSVNKNSIYKLVSDTLYPSEGGCEKGWYKLYYEDISTGYVCSEYVVVKQVEKIEVDTTDPYYRPWTTPKQAIRGGAKYISVAYIEKGQYTSYLKKFNVNPNGSYKVYNHQYMANLAAPYSEAYSSYKSYKENDLLKLPLEFTIPIFDNMPDYTELPGRSSLNECQSEILDEVFEEQLNNEGFPESYKCKLRIIHNNYINWTFKAMHTSLDFSKSVIAEQNVSSIQGGDIYYDLSSGSRIETENKWYRANYNTVAYYLDPRNFLIPERILMFENLGFSENYTESVVESILVGTFMADYSFLDNEPYSQIFVEAGKNANISSVYLASLARQESGTKGSRATSGDEFTYKGITYKNLYNFFNIGAYSSAESPILAGLVWASNGNNSVIVTNDTGENSTEISTYSLTEAIILQKLGAVKQNNCLTNINLGTTLSSIKNVLNDLTVNIEGMTDEDVIKTGQTLVVTDGENTYSFLISIKGDVDGDGYVGATDYVKIKNYIMERNNSELDISQSIAADVDGNGEIGATDYVKIKNSIMER